MKSLTHLLILSLFFLSSCFYDNEQDLFLLDTECDTSEVTYSEDVLDILKAKCYRCHGDGNFEGGISLDGYSLVKIFADNGFLLGTIKHESGFSAMPPNVPKIPDCDIEKIEKWIEEGALEN